MVDDPIDKIEFVVFDLITQLAMVPLPSKITLRSSENEADHQLNYRKKNGKKLLCNIMALTQVHQLLIENRRSTIRDLYYDFKSMYIDQSVFNRSISDICDLLNTQRIDLNVLAAGRGLVYGPLVLESESSNTIDCRVQPVLIAESLMKFDVISDATFVLVVEKDATFQKLIDNNFAHFFPRGILATGKGYPDFSTRSFLRWLIELLQIPIFGLFDADPHGLEIMLTYKYGSTSERCLERSYKIPDIQWIGLKPSDIQGLNVDDCHYLSMNNREFARLARVRRRALGLGEMSIVEEADILREIQYKFELEAITSSSNVSLTNNIILNAINQGLS